MKPGTCTVCPPRDSVKRCTDKIQGFLSTHVLGNKRLRVHLWETPISGPPRLLRCNCDQPGRHSPIGAVVGRMALDPSWHVPQAVPLVQAQAPAYQYLVPSNYAPQAPTLAVSSLTTDMASLRVTPTAAQLVAQRDAYNAYAARQAHLARQQQGGSIYLTTAGGIPVNVENGAVRTESRGVFVGKLKYSARARDVEALFQKAGKIIDCKLRVDPTTGKSKGSATILYAFAAQAMVAVEKFNNYEFMGKRLEVRIDKESTAISPPAGARAPSTEVQPIIVNGSNKVDVRLSTDL